METVMSSNKPPLKWVMPSESDEETLCANAKSNARTVNVGALLNILKPYLDKNAQLPTSTREFQLGNNVLMSNKKYMTESQY